VSMLLSTSVSQYFLSVGAGLLLLAAFIGYGRLWRGLVPVTRSPFDWASDAARGLATSVIVGGVLNNYGLISPWSARAYVVLGSLLCLFAIVRQLKYCVARSRISPTMAAAAVGVVALALVSLAGQVTTQLVKGRNSATSFNHDDDFQGYLVFPVQMLQTGAMTDDPFNARRLTSSLGGHSFLQALLIAWSGNDHVHLLDPGIASLIFLGLVLHHGWNVGLSSKWLLFLASCVVFLPWPVVNITAMLAGAALFYDLISLFPEFGTSGSRRVAILVGVEVAAVCALKSSFVPPACLLVLSMFLGALVRPASWRVSLQCAIILSGTVLISLLPWMRALYRSSGTYLYPLLGRGYYGSAHGSFSPSAERGFTDIARLIASVISSPEMLGLAAIIVVVTASRDRCQRVLDAAVSAWGGTLFLSLVLGGFDVPRYAFAFVAATIVFASTNLIGKSVASGWSSMTALVGIGACVAVVAAGWKQTKLSYVDSLKSALTGLRGQHSFDARQEPLLKAMQASVPVAVPLMTRIERPFLLDFTRNHIYVIDWPGHASLPPGMPFFMGPEPLAAYLIQIGVRYVAYDYATEAGYSRKDWEGRLKGTNHLWERTVITHMFDFHDNLRALGVTRDRIFDDGERFVIDLAKPASSMSDSSTVKTPR